MLTQVFGLLSVLHGLGNHITLIMKVGELHNFLLFTWITVFFFNLAIPTGKVAVAAFLIEMNGQGSKSNLRTFFHQTQLTSSSDPKIRKSLVAVAVLNIVLNIPQVLLVWFQCSPVNALWDPLRQSDCDHRKSVYYTYFVGAVAAISDFYLAIVPIQMLLPLRIDRKLKWGLGFLMGCGVFAGVAAIVRTWAAKFILTEDSSCKASFFLIYQGPTLIIYRRCRYPLPLGRSRRMDRTHHNVHSTRVASLPPIHIQIYQIKPDPKPAALQLPIRPQIQLQRTVQHYCRGRPVTRLPTPELPPSSRHDNHLHILCKGRGDHCCLGSRVASIE